MVGPINLSSKIKIHAYSECPILLCIIRILFYHTCYHLIFESYQLSTIVSTCKHTYVKIILGIIVNRIHLSRIFSIFDFFIEYLLLLFFFRF